MKRLFLLTLTVAALAGISTSGVARAGDITNILRRPVQAINPYVPLVDVSTAIPTTQDILAVPTPTRRNRLMYPMRVVRYGLNVYPSARVARQNGLVLFDF